MTMKIYQVIITLGSAERIAADWLVSRAEAEAIRDTTHPALKPEVREVEA
jgi:hypothetical protein